MVSLLLLEEIAQLLLVMLIGYLAVKFRVLEGKDSMVLSKIILYVLGPCMILRVFQMEFDETVRCGLLYSFGLSLTVQTVLVIMGWVLKKVCNLSITEEAVIVYSNAGNLVMPVVASVFGKEWVIYTSAYITVQLFFLWTLGYSQFTGNHKIKIGRITSNINLLSVSAGFLLLVTGFRFPDFVNNTLDTLGDMLGVSAMLVTGMLAQGIDWKKILRHKRIYWITFCRLLLCPLLLIFLFWAGHVKRWVNHGDILSMLVLLAAMTPSSTTILQFAVVYKKEADYAGAITILTTVGCVATIPLLVWIYFRFI